jgi:FkbM family methyltransferase
MSLMLSTPRPRLRKRLLRLAILSVIVIGATAFTRALTHNEELEWFKKAYGPSRHSQYAEEWLIRDFFGNRRGGVFVDVGSSHYKKFSNTYYLEHVLGWSGIAIDAQHEFEADYVKHRPRTRFFSAFVSDHSGGIESFFVPERNRLVASSNKQFSDRYDVNGKERKVPTITLNDLLERVDVKSIDFLSMDIELAEPKALAGLDLARYRPRLVCVEAHPEIRQQLLDYFAERQYRVVGRYLRADPSNLWFAPMDALLPKALDVAHTH